jgi:hypothetical protein
MTGYGLQIRRPALDSQQRQEIFLFSIAFRLALGSKQGFSPEINRSEREADDSPTYSSEVNTGGAIRPLLHMSPWHGASIINHKANFMLLLYFHHVFA